MNNIVKFVFPPFWCREFSLGENGRPWGFPPHTVQLSATVSNEQNEDQRSIFPGLVQYLG